MAHTEFKKALFALGETPLPRYIKRPVEPADAEHFQTIFARNEGELFPFLLPLGCVLSPRLSVL
jgi:S-adenosylmethionine:tRNA-ribosyltransferase-isomerase (queuine synthetase)